MKVAHANCEGASPLSGERAKAQNPDCDKNFKADHDVKGSNLFSGSHVCFDTYKTIVKKIDDYDQLRSTSCQEIRGLVAKAKSCKTDDCFAEAKEAYLGAAKKERDLASFLATTKTEIEKMATEADKVLEKYRDDNRTMIAAINRAREEQRNLTAQVFSSIGQPDESLKQRLEKVNQLLDNAKGVQGTQLVASPVPRASGVSARDGGGTSIVDYQKNKIPELVEEQSTAKLRAQAAAKKAAQQEQYHQKQAAMYERLAASSASRKEKTKTAGEDTEKVAGKNPEDQAQNSQISEDPKEGESAGSPSGGGGSPPGGSDSPPPGSDPYQSTVGDSNTGDVAQKKNPTIASQNKKNGGKTFDVSAARSKSGDLENLRNQLRAEINGIPGRTSATQERNLASGASSSATAGSDGVSNSAAGSSGGGSAEGKETDEAKKDDPRFGENLDAGFVDIAGSEIANSVNSLAEELGIQPSDDLAVAEAADLPLAEESVSADPALLKEESLALFVRTKLAIRRAQSRGDLSGVQEKKFFPFF
jgi:hypothetical protein